MFELLLLSTRIAGLVLAGSLLGFVLGWLWRGYRARHDVTDFHAKLDAEHGLRTRIQDQADAARKQADDLIAASRESENQCIAALQQRDEAERQAADMSNRLRGMQEQLERAQRGAVDKEVHVRLEDEFKQQLAAEKERVSALESQLAEAKAAAGSADELTKVREELAAALASKASVEGAKRQLETEVSRISDLERELLEAKAAAGNADELAKVREELEAALATKATAEQAAKTTADDLVQALRGAEEKAASATAALAAEVEVLKSRCDVAEMAQLEAEDALEKARAALAAAEARESSQRQSVSHIEAELAEMRSQLAKAGTVLAEAQAEASKLTHIETPKETPAPAKPTPTVQPKPAAKPRLFAPIAFNPPAAAPAVPASPAPAAEPDFMDFPPAPSRSVQDLVRHHPPLKPGPKPNFEAVEAALSSIASKRAEATDEPVISALDAQLTVVKKMKAAAEAAGDDTDDLTQIKGIKAVINKQLLDHGVCTFRQIADWNDEELHAFSELLSFKNRAIKDRWREQASELVARKEVQRAR